MIGSQTPNQRLEARVEGTYADLGWTMPGARSEDSVPRLRPFASVGDDDVEELFGDYGFVYPYTLSDGDYVYRDSGLFVPREVAVQQQSDGSVLADLVWSLPEDSALTHFAVTIEAWDERPEDGEIPDVVFVDVATISPTDDSTAIRCE